MLNREPSKKAEGRITELFEMPEMTEDDFKAAIYGHLHQIKNACPKAEGVYMGRELHGFRLQIDPYFIATFWPSRGEYQFTTDPEAQEFWKENFDNMLDCSHCINNKQKILAQAPDYFEGETSEDKSDTNDKGDSNGEN